MRAFALSIPVAESAIGVLLVVGSFTRWALAAGLLIAALVFGTALRGQCDTLATQMVYALIFVVLLAARHYDRISVDGWRTRGAGVGVESGDGFREPAACRH